MAPNYGEDSDVASMMRVARGERAAFEKLVLKYQKAVINVAYRYTGNPGAAEELAQEVFLRVYRAAPTYRPDARFSTWLFTIVRNVCSNYRLREGRLERKTDPEIESFDLSHRGEDPEAQAVRKEREKRIRAAVQELPDTLRMPLILHQFQQMQYEEIAQVLGISLASVKVRIHRARQALLEKLRELVE
jgi:RNA polymerase sigma-70 factor (ECF subfamily)